MSNILAFIGGWFIVSLIVGSLYAAVKNGGKR